MQRFQDLIPADVNGRTWSHVTSIIDGPSEYSMDILLHSSVQFSLKEIIPGITIYQRYETSPGQETVILTLLTLFVKAAYSEGERRHSELTLTPLDASTVSE